MTQGLLFGKTIQQRFEEFHERHPEVYADLVARARRMLARGVTRYSIRTLYEITRWHFQFEKDLGEEFKLNDHFHSRYARLIMEQEPDLSEFFEVRKLRAA